MVHTKNVINWIW